MKRPHIGEEPSIRVFVDKKSIFIGDRIRYTIKVEAKKGLEVEFPKFPAESGRPGRIGEFEIKDSGKNWYEVTAYSVGKHRIPPLEIKYRGKGKADWASVKTDEITVTVESVLPKEETIRDIKDIKGPIHYGEVNWLLVLCALAILAFCVMGIIVYKRRRKIPIRLPHETALEELEVIKGIFAQDGDVKRYYIGVSGCVRNYVERRFELRAPEMTTEEFLSSLKDSDALPYDEKELLKEFLSSCDLVKFAKYAPTKKETESVFDTAKNFIEPKG